MEERTKKDKKKRKHNVKNTKTEQLGIDKKTDWISDAPEGQGLHTHWVHM